jgi:hypothetical protein
MPIPDQPGWCAAEKQISYNQQNPVLILRVGGVYQSPNVEETKLAEGVAGFWEFELQQRTKLNVTMIPTFAVQRKKSLKNVLITPKTVTNV